MAVFRINKTNGYSVMSNAHFRDRRMSLKAKGLLSLMLSLPDDWDYTEEGLTQLSCDGLASVRAGLKELEQFGFLRRAKITNAKGQFQGMEYNIYENPFGWEGNEEYIDITRNAKKPFSENPIAEKPMAEKPIAENRIQLNTNIQNTNELNNKEVSKNKYGEFQNVLLTEEEYRKVRGLGLEDIIEELSSYLASSGKRYKSHYATILNWGRRKKKETKKGNLKSPPSYDLNKIKERSTFADNYLEQLGLV